MLFCIIYSLLPTFFPLLAKISQSYSILAVEAKDFSLLINYILKLLINNS